MVDGTVTETVVGVATLTVGVTADRTDTLCAVTSVAVSLRLVCVFDSADEVAWCVVPDLSVVSTSGVATFELDAFVLPAVSVVASVGCSDFFSASAAEVVLSPVFCWADTVEVGPVDDDVDAEEVAESDV